MKALRGVDFTKCEQVMKVSERVVEGLIRQRVEIDEMQCGFMSGRGTTDATFIVHQLQEKHLAANKPVYMAFVDLEKAFDRVPRDVIWWAMRKLGIVEWLVRLVQSGCEKQGKSRRWVQRGVWCWSGCSSGLCP